MDCEVARTITICQSWKIRINSLSLWLYCILVLAFEGYLLFRAVEHCRRYNELPWRPDDGGRPVAELYGYISLIVANVMCLPFLVVFSLFQVGNYANDGVRLGRDSTRIERFRVGLNAAGDAVVTPDRTGVDLKSSWRHIGPFSQTIHILSAFCLLLPRVLVQAQQIKYGFLPVEAMWWSNLDIIVGRQSYHLQIEEESYKNSSVSSSTPQKNDDYNDEMKEEYVAMISFYFRPEFLNYCLALFFYSLRYASVFWYTEMALSILFSLQLFLSAVHFALSYCGMEILYKLLLNQDLVSKEINPQNLMLSSTVFIVLFLTTNVIIYFSPIVCFNYGYSHYRRAWKLFMKRTVPIAMQLHDDDDDDGNPKTCCHGYTQHILAMVLLLMMVGLRLTIVFDFVTVYKTFGSRLILVCLLADVIYMLSWILLWFVFTVQQNWNFKMILAKQLIWNATCCKHIVSPAQDAAAEDVLPKFSSSSMDGLHVEVIRNTQSLQPSKSMNSRSDLNEKRMSHSSAASDTTQPPVATRKHGMLDGRKMKQGTCCSHEADAGENGKLKLFTKTSASAVDHSTRSIHLTELEIDQCRNSDRFFQKKNLSQASNAEILRHSNESQNVITRKKNKMIKNQIEKPAEAADSSNSRGTNNTPENTLTRGYQCSIRDKCGQYFKRRKRPPRIPSQKSSEGLPSASNLPCSSQDGPCRTKEIPSMKSSDHSKNRNVSPSAQVTTKDLNQSRENQLAPRTQYLHHKDETGSTTQPHENSCTDRSTPRNMKQLNTVIQQYQLHNHSTECLPSNRLTSIDANLVDHGLRGTSVSDKKKQKRYPDIIMRPTERKSRSMSKIFVTDNSDEITFPVTRPNSTTSDIIYPHYYTSFPLPLPPSSPLSYLQYNSKEIDRKSHDAALDGIKQIQLHQQQQQPGFVISSNDESSNDSANSQILYSEV